jgi:hypothetical protein
MLSLLRVCCWPQSTLRGGGVCEEAVFSTTEPASNFPAQLSGNTVAVSPRVELASPYDSGT